MLNKKTFQKSLEYLEFIKKQKGNEFLRNIHLNLDTNGTLIDNPVIKIIKQHKVIVNITLDGPQKIHDYYRIDKEGKGTFRKVLEVLKLLQKEKIDTRISITVTPLNFKLLKTFLPFLLKYKITKFTFIPLTDQALLYLNPKINLKKYHEEVAEEIIKSFQIARKLGLYEYRLEKKAEAFQEKNFFPTDCGGYGNQIVIHPDATISNCSVATKYKLGNLTLINENFRIWNAPIIKKWRRRLPLYNRKCLTCKAISICGGGCPWSVNMTKGNIFSHDESNCVFIKKFFQFLTSKI